MTTRTSAATPTVAPLSIVDGTHGEFRPRWQSYSGKLSDGAEHDYLDTGDATCFMAAYFATKLFGLDIDQCTFSGRATDRPGDCLLIKVYYGGHAIREISVRAEDAVSQTIAAGTLYVEIEDLSAIGVDITALVGEAFTKMAGLPSNAPLIFDAEITPDLRKLSLEVSLLW